MKNPRHKANSYKNVMELLVDNEIDRQTCTYPKQMAETINRIEVAAYALNSLTPLYASSQEGVSLQYERGQKEMSEHITAVVRDALSAVARHPQRESTPFSYDLSDLSQSEAENPW